MSNKTKTKNPTWLIIDNNLADEFPDHFKKISYLEKINTDDIIVLLTSDKESCYRELRLELMKYIPVSQFIDIFSHSMYFDKDIYYDQPYERHPRLRALEYVHREIYMNNVDGAVAECGVYRGWFSNYISRYFPDRKIYLFDTFSGFDNRDIDEQEDKDSGSFRKYCDLDDTSVELALSAIGYSANAIIKKGFFPDTAVGLEDEKFSFVSLDTDLYKPILAGLEFFYPRLCPGGVIFVDDIGHKQLLGVRRAIIDFCKQNGVGYVNCFDGIDATGIVAKPL